MRITNNIIQKNALAQMQTGLRQISRAERQVSTGLRLARPSDDPTAASNAMEARGSLRALEQYRRNLGVAEGRAVAEESVLDQITDVLSRAKELGFSQVNATADSSTRAMTKAEVDELIQHVIQLGNTRYSGEYLFGGNFSDVPPFDASQTGQTPLYVALDDTGAPRDLQGVAATEISAGRYLESTHDGKELLLDSGVLSALKQLSDALADTTDPDAAIGAALVSVDGAIEETQQLLGEIGARTNQIEVTHANLDALEINLQTLKSDMEDVDLEKAVTELMSRQTAFQAAMLATSRVMGLTLADYLR